MEASNIPQSNPSEGKTLMDNVIQVKQEQEVQDNNKMDTVTMARQEREKNGPWEAEISYGGEADLHRHLDGCEKNPGHLKFVPVDLFDVDHLPYGCQDKLLVEMIRAQSDVTVRVSVKYVSERRPETFPGSNKPYPFYRNSERNMMRVGTGWVWRVGIFPNKDDINKTTCWCKECLNSLTPKTQFARIYILTATHVVFDGLEGEDTTCHLFFDRGGTPDICDGVVALSGMSRVVRGIGGDLCWMVHVTHDLDLAHRLNKMVDHRSCLVDKVNSKYGPRDYPPPTYNKQETGSEPDPLQKLTIIVSHPHGCSKQVSVGYSTNKVESEDGDTQFTYSTATCPGSSGATVFVMVEPERAWNLYLSNIHSGNCQGNKDLNFSSWTWFQLE